MALPALVLVHGGTLAADSWELTVDEIRRLAPESTVVTVGLPGRRSKAGDLRTLTIPDWVDSVVGDIDDAGLNDIVIVGHSMAGLIVPGVVTKLGSSRVREMVLAAACVPTEGVAVVDVVAWPSALNARRNANKDAPYTMPLRVVRFAVFNGVPRARRRLMLMAGRFYAESSQIPMERVSRRGMPRDVPRTWILTLRDRTHPVKEQRASIEAIGGVPRRLDELR